jgi:hypothetical protein
MTPTPATPGGLDLAPCPFCGSTEVRCRRNDHKGGPLVGKPFWQAECLDCDAETARYFECDSDIHEAEGPELGKLAAQAWNRRSQVSGGEGAPAGLRERLAALCHEQWSGWMKYLFGKCEILPNAERGDLAVIPEWAVQRWKRQMETPYASLSDKEKDSDRAEADRFLALLPAPAVPDALTWTREKPTQTGSPFAVWYWFRYGPGHPMEPLSLEMIRGEIQYFHAFQECYYDLPAGEWAGPIPEPREAPPAPMNEGEVK